MIILRILLKIILVPVSLVLLLLKGAIHLAINLTSAVIGFFILYVGFALVFCLVTQRWTHLFIFFLVGLMTLGILLMVVMVEELIEELSQKIREI